MLIAIYCISMSQQLFVMKFHCTIVLMHAYFTCLMNRVLNKMNSIKIVLLTYVAVLLFNYANARLLYMADKQLLSCNGIYL